MQHWLIIIFTICFLKLEGQTYQEFKSKEVGCVEFHREGFNLSFPVIELMGIKNVNLRFDIFGNNQDILYYEVELCDFNWTPVSIDKLDYLEGFFGNTVDVFSTSIITTTDYVQYRLQIPNNDLNILMPGNYIVRVFRTNQKIDTLLQRKFVVYDERIKTDIKYKKLQSGLYGDRQEFEVVLQTQSISFSDLIGNIKLCIIQNNNWNTSRFYDNYTTDGNNAVIFSLSGQIVYNGINEFRIFDTKSLKYDSERVDYIDYKAPNYHVYLKPDKLRGDKQYFSSEDLNGLFFIGNQESRYEDLMDTDYAFVHFTLHTGVPLPFDIYIEGALTEWKYSQNYMVFDPETGNYKAALFLKQGLYNYRYAAKEYDSSTIEYDITEGNYYETKNQYMAIVYYRDLGEEYYYPIGVGSINTGD